MATSTKETLKKEKDKGLKKCFAALVDRKQINLELDVLKLMLKHELQINTDSIDENLSSILPFMLAIYIKNWPGWQRSKEYYSGKLNFKEWFDKFRQFIVIRLNYLIKNGYDKAVQMLQDDMKKEKSNTSKNVEITTHCTQTDNLMSKSVAPYRIVVECPPNLVGSLIFAEIGDDIILRSHHEIPWTKIGLKELLNWPYISVEFSSPELSFKRKNCGEITRYVDINNSPVAAPKDIEYIDHVEIVNPTATQNCYTLNMLRAYANQYVSILQSAKGIKKEVEVIELVLEEFLKDVEEININNSMATNTAVVFNMGRSTFLRNKKISKNKNSSYCSGTKLDICYSESFIPKMETTLNYFKGVQDTSTPDVSFSYLNIVRVALINNNHSSSSLGYAMPALHFYCDFCTIKFNSPYQLMDHLENHHKMEPSYICCVCMSICPIYQLSAKRWNHGCSDSKKG